MNGPPTIGVKGSKPHFRPAKEELPELNRDYIQTRTRTQAAKAEAAEIDLELKKGTLISKKLVGLQVGYMLTSYRQKVLAAPQAIARKLPSAQLITPQYEHQAAALIRQDLLEMLSDLATLPAQAMNSAGSDWIEQIDPDLEKQVPFEERRRTPEEVKQKLARERLLAEKRKETLRKWRKSKH